MKKMNIYDVLAWIGLIVSAILIIWYILGNSPAEFFVIVSLLFVVYTKISSVENKVVENKINLKNHIDNCKNHIGEYHKNEKN